ncbi:MAG: ketopantoate reductase family protein [Rhodopseudomonas sp.]|uniref:ketopantoate reductase family protein n=1 Tax=Rhodopseudomonas sp. TaxID=1078 RepID=UPI0017DCCB2A|nr:ketopantoate reductase family protein [Rhodopseudomonas sp.]NVN85232.1 ketopantoate reductase family protein [Rhodopseudomonas sp.]
MKIAVMGAGAVGCFYGAMLARAGHSVTLIGRAQHVEAVTQRGLILETSAFRESVPVQATTQMSGLDDAELVLFCVKSADTEPTGRAMASHLRPEAVILSLQNGVDNAERLQAAIGRQVVAAVVYVATEMAGPGHVKHHGRGELVLGRSATSDALAATFSAAGIPTTVSDNVTDVLWGKLIVNCAYNAMSAIAQLPYGRLLEVEGVSSVMKDVVHECAAVARASGVSVADDAADRVIALAATMPTQFSSTAQDLARGKTSEIDYLNGHIVRKGAELAIPTPANRVLHTLVKLLEDKAARPL